jgi:hypothetical protein
MPDATGGVAPNAEEQDKALQTRLTAMFEKLLPGVVNSAVTSQLKRVTKSFDEKLAALAPKPAAEVEGEEVEVESKGAKPKPTASVAEVTKPADDPRIAALQKQLAKMQADSEAATKLAQTERRQRLESDGHSAVRKALSGKVIAGSEDTVLAALRGRNAITIGDNGDVRVRLGVQGEPEEGHDITEGIGAFLKSPEAAFFTPAPNGGAGGAKRGTQTGAPRAGAASESTETKFEAKFGKPIADLI